VILTIFVCDRTPKGKETIEIAAEKSGFNNKETYRQANKTEHFGQTEQRILGYAQHRWISMLVMCQETRPLLARSQIG
jgi:hypothetical protein